MKKIIILFIGLYSVTISGQNTLRPNIYHGDLNYYNVAAGLTAMDANSMLSVYGKHKFIDNELYDKNPNVSANFVSRIDGSNSTYSASYIYDNYSFYDRHTIYTGYSYRMKFAADNHSLNFGARAVFNFDRIKWDDLAVAFDKTGSNTYITPDLEFGILYQRDKLIAGVSVKNIFENTKEFEGSALLKNQREWYAHASYRFDPSRKVSLTPYTLLMIDRKFSFDLGLHSSFYKLIEASYHFRLEGTRNVGTLAVNATKSLKIGATLDYSFVHDDTNLEAMIAYRFK